MGSAKNWNYEQITDAARKRIGMFMAKAAEQTTEENAKIFKQWAYGAYLMWLHLTVGFQEREDDERLQALIL